MKLPRGVSADRLIGALEHLGYRKVRQKGSHVRLRHEGPPRPDAQPAEDRHVSRHPHRSCSDEVNLDRCYQRSFLNVLDQAGLRNSCNCRHHSLFLNLRDVR